MKYLPRSQEFIRDLLNRESSISAYQEKAYFCGSELHSTEFVSEFFSYLYSNPNWVLTHFKDQVELILGHFYPEATKEILVKNFYTV